METATPGVTAEVIENAAETVAEAATAAVEAAEATAEAAIEHAEERVEAAEEIAEKLTDAALLTAIGQQVTELRREGEAWRTQTQTELNNLAVTVANLSRTVEEIAARPVAVIAPVSGSENLSQSIPPQSVAEKVTVETVAPANQSESGEAENPVVETRQRRKRVI